MIDLNNFPKLLKEWCFDINLQNYNNLYSSKKYWWKCKINEKHIWNSTLNHRINGRSCPYCANQKVLEEESFGALFPELLKEWNDNNFNPFKMAPKSSKKIQWKCKKNHKWCVSICHRTNGSSCPKCSGRISKSETKWLDKIEKQNNIKIDRNLTICINDKRLHPDGFHKETNTIYEYNGYYWHGHPDYYNPRDIHPVNKISYGELYQNTLEKEELIKSGGYNLIVEWGK